MSGVASASNDQSFAMLLTVGFSAAALGVIKPYTERVRRWQFAIASIIFVVVIGATTDPTKFKTEEAAADKVAKAPATTKPKAKPSPQSRQTSATKSDDDPLADETKQGLWIVKSRDAIKSRLRDPSSADFRNVRFYSGGPVPVVCGEVDSKNGFGGYTGFQRFIASGDDPNIAFVASDVAVGDSINAAWDQLCIKAKRDEAFVP